MGIRDITESLASDFSIQKLIRFLREKEFNVRQNNALISLNLTASQKIDIRLADLFNRFSEPGIAGYTPLHDGTSFPVFFIKMNDGTLTERSSRKLQFDYAKRILLFVSANFDSFTLPAPCSHGIFVFVDNTKHVRMSLIEGIGKADSKKRYRRYTFYIDPDATNKTFIERMCMDWSSFEKIKEAFSVERLNKEFYSKLSNWYFWALGEVHFPGCDDKDDNAVPLIRMITRLIFVWFMKQKGLIPNELFQKKSVAEMLNSLEEDDSSYYKAILQNLFFATLNTEMNDPESRIFRKGNSPTGYNEQYQIFSVYRYEKMFTAAGKNTFLALIKNIPFLNGGLFSCLDDEKQLIDCFSDNPSHSKQLSVPNELFWTEESDNRHLDLSKVYGDRTKKRELLQGLIPLLAQYNFTIDESSPNDATIALDPELLGRIFENLLASYNPETATTARKQTGSFYTPREIVDYMVEQSLTQHILTVAENNGVTIPEKDINLLVSPDDSTLPQSITSNKRLITQAIEKCTILDPACGSGAFPMGLLSAFIRVLEKLNPAKNDTELYNRKLKLIQNCIYGVDIQPIAVQISKLRCFISLLADDDIDESEANRGIEPLPNLEMHFVAANSLIDVEGPRDGAFLSPKTEKIKCNMQDTAEKLFSVKKRVDKKNLQQKYMKLRGEFRESLSCDFNTHDYEKIADWDPFNQMESSPFFNPEWMFGIKDGFDIVIGNPPYVSYGLRGVGKLSKTEMTQLKTLYSNSAEYKVSLYAIFMELAIKLCKQGGIQSFIVPDSFLLGRYFSKIRAYILKLNNIVNLSFFTDQVFKAVVGISVIYLFKKSKNNCQPTRISKIENVKQIELGLASHFIAQKDYENIPRNRFRLYFSSQDEKLAKKIEQDSVPLDSYVTFSSGLIGKEGQDAIKSDYKVSSTWKKGIPSGSFVSKFCIKDTNFFINFDPTVIKSGYECINYALPKIFLRQTGDAPIAALDLNGLLALNNIHIGTSTEPQQTQVESLKTIVCILNSNLFKWYYQTISLEKGRVMAQLDIDVVDKLPIKMPSNKKAFVKMFDEFTQNEEDSFGQINDAVYSLYGLTKEEIEHIEAALDETLQMTAELQMETGPTASTDNNDDARE